MKNEVGNTIRRRSFLRRAGLAAAGLPAVKVLEAQGSSAAPPTKGDIAILKLLAAAEIIESDLWLQYSELGGTQDHEVSGENGGNALYTAALEILDGDMAQYIHDNTDDEKSHVSFLNNYLMSKGEAPVSLEQFRRLPSSQADGANKAAKRITNLTQLTVDTTFWSRYRSITNPDFDPGATFAQAVPSLATGQHTAIPRTNDDTAGSSLSSDNTKSLSPFLQAIAFTAGFHFAFIEQGGTSLYATLAQKVSSLEVLRILLSIGGSEIMHFQTWQDKAGNALPLTVVDPKTNVSVTFTDLTMAKGETSPESLSGDTLQANLIMPEPTHFLNPALGPVSIIRPTSTANSGAVAAIKSFQDDGLFIGQGNDFLSFVFDLAEKADDAFRQF
jgi:hypothetical protein